MSYRTGEVRQRGQQLTTQSEKDKAILEPGKLFSYLDIQKLILGYSKVVCTNVSAMNKHSELTISRHAVIVSLVAGPLF